MRSAYATLSASSEPPNPRLIVGTPGKSCASVVQNRIVELPTKTTALAGGGCTASFFVRVAISAAHFSGAATAIENRAKRITKYFFSIDFRRMVDLTGLEPVTFSMSRKRSNQLS